MSSYPLDRLIACLPQKPPFLFVDHVTEHEPNRRVAGLLRLPADHPIFINHLPDEPLVPGVICIEALAQISGLALVGSDGEPVRGYLAEVGPTRFYRLIEPDETIRLEASLERAFGDYARFEVIAWVGEELAVKGQVTVARRRGIADRPTATGR